jgi:hypothetical protein
VSRDLAAIALTRHTVERFNQRVKPALNPAQAERELRQLIRLHGRVRDGMPDWAEGTFDAAPDITAWLTIGADIALPLADGYRAVTCLTRAGFSEDHRAARRRRKRAGKGVRTARAARKPRDLKRFDKAQRSRERRLLDRETAG